MATFEQFVLNFKYAFRPRKPLLIARLVWAVIRSSIFRRPPLRYVDFAVNFACNLRCEHCFATALKQQPQGRTMTVDDYARVAEECMQLGAVNFSFQGGEPLLLENLRDIITACQPQRNVISITTNGTLLTQKRITELKDWGVDILTMSLDSADAEEHDRFRGVSGAFAKTKQSITFALQAGLRVTLGTVVTHQTLRSQGTADLINLAQEIRVLLYFILPVPAGRWVDNQDMFLTDEDLAYIHTLTHSSPYLRTDFQANLGQYGCGAAKEILYLTPYGDVLTCPFLHISPGNIFKESIADIRKRALQNPYFAKYHQKCLVSTDKEFIQQYLSHTFQAEKLPLGWDDVFSGEIQEGNA